MSASAAEMEDLIDKATAEHLSGPEWQINMAVCDLANANHAICDDIVRYLQRKLQSGSPRVTLQALILTETVVKNGPKVIHTQIASRSFLQQVAALTDGSMGFDVQNQALLLIKQWADAFAGSPLSGFQDIYRQLKLQGVVFPEAENDVPIFTPPSSQTGHLQAARSNSSYSESAASSVAGGDSSRGNRTRAQQIAKLHADIQVVMDKIALLREFRSTGERGEPLEDVLDFLRQCQPRMNTLIEGGIMGKIDERTLEMCLNVNDNLIKALEETRTPDVQTEDLLRFDSPPRAQRKTTIDSVASPNTVSENVSRMSLQEGNRMVTPSTHSTLTSMDDEFDSFLNSRSKQ